MKSGVYQIVNLLNGKRYVGSAVWLHRRWKDHIKRLRRGHHRNAHLQNAFDRYGETAFLFSILEMVEIQSLTRREQYYLDTLQPEYNILPIAGSNLGYRHTAKTLRRMSKALKGRVCSEETKQKISRAHMGQHDSAETRLKKSIARRGKRNPNYGKEPSRETRRKLSEAQKGRCWSEEHRCKLSEAQKGRRHSPETRAKMSRTRKAYWDKIHARS